MAVPSITVLSQFIILRRASQKGKTSVTNHKIDEFIIGKLADKVAQRVLALVLSIVDSFPD